MPFVVAAWFALVVVLFVAGFLGLVTYNAIVGLVTRIDRAWANIDVALRQRHDELPNLVNAVRDLMAYEQATLALVTAARNAYSAEASVHDQGVTSTQTTAAVRQLFAVVENYPALKSAANVLALQAEVERLEAVIADRRELYNDSVYRYNARIRQVPAVLFAGLFGWTAREFFAADQGDRDRPDASLRPSD
jgi:LemA protein